MHIAVGTPVLENPDHGVACLVNMCSHFVHALVSLIIASQGGIDKLTT